MRDYAVLPGVTMPRKPPQNAVQEMCIFDGDICMAVMGQRERTWRPRATNQPFFYPQLAVHLLRLLQCTRSLA